MCNPEWDNYKTPDQRYVILSDESGHDYFVPVGQEEKFEEWVQSFEEGTEDDYEGPEFDSNRIDGRFTFTDPKCN
jgi:hypothetical protein